MADYGSRGGWIVLTEVDLTTLLSRIVDERMGHLEARILACVQVHSASPATTNTDDPMLSVKDLAHRLGVSERTIRRYERSGRLPGAVRIGGVLRFPPEATEQLTGSDQWTGRRS